MLPGWRFSARACVLAEEPRPRDAASSAGAVTTVKLLSLPLQLVSLVYFKAEPLQEVPHVLLRSSSFTSVRPELRKAPTISM